ncbi:MAG TPA: RNA 2',3'-cyclic phosphodiesterase [Solirubrobacteraceae bacterium]
MSGERARLFVALDLPADVRSALFGWARAQVGGMARIRLVEPASLHVTLCFLGSRPVDEVDGIAAACAVVSGLPAATLALGPALWLPPRRPRVLTVELADEQGRLAAAQAVLARALVDTGVYEPEKRPFLAHVTVARVQREGRPHRGQLPAPDPLRFPATTVTLYRSHTGSGPARYEPLAHVPLQG